MNAKLLLQFYTIKILFAWYDIWMGAYIDRDKGCVYICPIPMFVIAIQYKEVSKEQTQVNSVRDIVQEFGFAMEQVLRENDWKGGWIQCDNKYLLSRIAEEYKELIDVCYYVEKENESRINISQIRKEAVDVANFAMMIYDNAGKKNTLNITPTVGA